MTMNEIMNNKGVKLEIMNHPAKNGDHRYGRIRKELKLEYDEASYSIVSLEVNTYDESIEVHFLKGSMPYADNLFWALLADRDVRRLIKKYQQTERNIKYKIWFTEGKSGRRDFFKTLGYEVGSFATTETKRICHISSAGKLNEKFGDAESKMEIGDFVEMVAFMKLAEDMNVRSLRKEAGVKYIRPKFVEEIADFTTNVTKIL